jgi:hypothetical protein
MPTLIEIASAMSNAADAIVGDIRTLLTSKGFNPNCDSVLIPVAELHKIAIAALKRFRNAFSGWYNPSQMPPETTMKWLYSLGIEQLAKCAHPYRGAIWSLKAKEETQFYLWCDKPKRLFQKAA